ncbi:exodeoxyribonuclease VII large subunit [Acidipila rosea]|uniref:Exodeoxyribonuclease 7 large subunit n=1 Tax=Acidipila rosea TaxID=768535 RepID=A0A4R1LCT7_9BACT|nr:exodeoxyribonuclease VII large subunit [Acidipila rosea]TCK74369.1 exodeoxyribonuclease VII large subunit [Acidipila rosea]
MSIASRESGDWQLGFRFEAPPAPARRIWSVGELVGEVRSHIEREYADLWVEGEISNLRSAPSGHIYFTLKDGDAQLPAVLFRRQASLLRFRPEDGLQILLRGKVSVYEQRGQMQLVAEFLEPVGAGSLQVAFEQLKGKLQQEGLFEAERKKPLPAFPRCVGIITSPTGAVIRDFLNVAGRRHAALDVLLFPALVQGESAAMEVAAGIAYFNTARNVDVVVIARGGGSLEDLAPFNSEMLARAIAASELPVVSAVGHETDFTIADFVADLRAPTPSAAAELITAAQHRVEERVEELTQRLVRASRYRMMQARELFTRLSTVAMSGSIRDLLNRRQQRVDELRFRMENAMQSQLRLRAEQLQRLTTLTLRRDPVDRLAFARRQLDSLDARASRAGLVAVAAARQRHSALTRQLNALSPLGVLRRGYALVFDEDGLLVRDTAQLTTNQHIRTRLAKGSFESRVTQLTTDKEV